MRKKTLMVFLAGMLAFGCLAQDVLAAQVSINPENTPIAENADNIVGADEAESSSNELGKEENMTDKTGDDQDQVMSGESQSSEQPGEISGPEDSIGEEASEMPEEDETLIPEENAESEVSDQRDGNEEEEVEILAQDQDLIMPYSLVSYSYNPRYSSPVTTTIGGVSYTSIRDAAKSTISGNEGNYTSVHPNDNGALSIGYMQWHAGRALNLLRTIISKNNAESYDILGDSLYNEIIKGNISWSARTLNSDEVQKIQSLLGTTNGRKAQDEWAVSDINDYINHGYNLGIRNVAALVYFSDVENQWGSGNSTKFANYAYNLTKDWSRVTLNEMHIAMICFEYPRSTNYIKRRRSTYGTAANLGWTYCNSGDNMIPYDDYGTTGTRWLQNALNIYQNAGLTVDGSYGPATKAAVMTFQKSVGLSADGYAGQNTSSALVYKMYYDQAINGNSSTLKNGLVYENGKYIYYKNGVKDTSYTWLTKYKDTWYYVENGVANLTYTGLAQNEYGWWYLQNGKVNFNFSGFARNENGWWRIVKGQVDFSCTDVMSGTVNNETAWWFVKGGKVQLGVNSVEKNAYGWWRIENGKVNFSFSGLAQNAYGWWGIINGKVDFSYIGLVQNEYGWWYLRGGQIMFSYTGLAQNSAGWWRIENGKVNFGYNGIAQNEYGWWYIRSGKVIFDYTGWVTVQSGRYWVQNGKVDR